MLSGGSLSGIKYLQAQTAITEGRDASDTNGFQNADQAYQSARETKQITDIIFYSGVLMTGGGWLLQRDVAVVPWSTHSGRGLAISLNR